MTNFASGEGILICKKTALDKEIEISIYNGWNIKWATMEFSYMEDSKKGRFEFTECKGNE